MKNKFHWWKLNSLWVRGTRLKGHWNSYGNNFLTFLTISWTPDLVSRESAALSSLLWPFFPISSVKNVRLRKDGLLNTKTFSKAWFIDFSVSDSCMHTCMSHMVHVPTCTSMHSGTALPQLHNYICTRENRDVGRRNLQTATHVYTHGKDSVHFKSFTLKWTEWFQIIPSVFEVDQMVLKTIPSTFEVQ